MVHKRVLQISWAKLRLTQVQKIKDANIADVEAVKRRVEIAVVLTGRDAVIEVMK